MTFIDALLVVGAYKADLTLNVAAREHLSGAPSDFCPEEDGTVCARLVYGALVVELQAFFLNHLTEINTVELSPSLEDISVQVLRFARVNLLHVDEALARLVSAVLEVNAPEGELLFEHFLLILGSARGIEEVRTVSSALQVVNHKLEGFRVSVNENGTIVQLVKLQVKSIGSAFMFLNLVLFMKVHFAEHCVQVRLGLLYQGLESSDDVRSADVQLDELAGLRVHFLNEDSAALLVEASRLVPVVTLLEGLKRKRTLQFARHVFDIRRVHEIDLTFIRFKGILEYTFHTNFDDWTVRLNFEIIFVTLSAHLPHLC